MKKKRKIHIHLPVSFVMLGSILVAGCSGGPCSGVDLENDYRWDSQQKTEMPYRWTITNSTNEFKLITLNTIRPSGRVARTETVRVEPKSIKNGRFAGGNLMEIDSCQ